MPPLIEPETPRLRLRQWTASDREPFAALNADPRVMEHFPAPLRRDQSDALAERAQAGIDQRGWGLWAVELKRTGEFVGLIGLKEAPAELPFAPCVEIAWRLAYAHWGQGYASEGARGALGAAFDGIALEEVVSFTALCNLRSQRVMERLGMRREAEPFDHPLVPAGHPLRPHCLYRLRRAEWESGGARGRVGDAPA